MSKNKWLYIDVNKLISDNRKLDNEQLQAKILNDLGQLIDTYQECSAESAITVLLECFEQVLKLHDDRLEQRATNILTWQLFKSGHDGVMHDYIYEKTYDEDEVNLNTIRSMHYSLKFDLFIEIIEKYNMFIIDQCYVQFKNLFWKEMLRKTATHDQFFMACVVHQIYDKYESKLRLITSMQRYDLLIKELDLLLAFAMYGTPAFSVKQLGFIQELLIRIKNAYIQTDPAQTMTFNIVTSAIQTVDGVFRKNELFEMSDGSLNQVYDENFKLQYYRTAYFSMTVYKFFKLLANYPDEAESEITLLRNLLPWAFLSIAIMLRTEIAEVHYHNYLTVCEYCTPDRIISLEEFNKLSTKYKQWVLWDQVLAGDEKLKMIDEQIDYMIYEGNDLLFSKFRLRGYEEYELLSKMFYMYSLSKYYNRTSATDVVPCLLEYSLKNSMFTKPMRTISKTYQLKETEVFHIDQKEIELAQLRLRRTNMFVRKAVSDLFKELNSIESNAEYQLALFKQSFPFILLDLFKLNGLFINIEAYHCTIVECGWLETKDNAISEEAKKWSVVYHPNHILDFLLAQDSEQAKSFYQLPDNINDIDYQQFKQRYAEMYDENGDNKVIKSIVVPNKKAMKSLIRLLVVCSLDETRYITQAINYAKIVLSKFEQRSKIKRSN